MAKKKHIKKVIIQSVKVYSTLALIAIIMYVFVCFVYYQTREYKYVQGMFRIENVIYVDSEPEVTFTPTENEETLFQITKRAVLNSNVAKKYSFMNWQNVKDASLKCCPQNDDTIIAQYTKSENCVYLSKRDMSENIIIRVFMHELIHSATIDGKVQGTLYEAIAEKLTYELIDEFGLSTDMSTGYGLYIWQYEMYETIIDKNIVEYIYNGELEAIVNEYTETAYFEYADSALAYAYDEENEKKRNRYLRISQDVLVHFAESYITKNYDSTTAQEKLKQVEDMLLIKEKYFSKILNREN